MALNTFKDLFYNRLCDIYDAEKQLSQILPTMAESAQSDELRSLLNDESKSIDMQLSRLDSAFRTLGVDHDSVISKGMRGIVEEAEEIIEEDGDPSVKDAAIIAIAQEMKHYEMAAYGSVRSWAKDLDLPDVAKLLQDSLDDEGDSDKKLTGIAEGSMFAKGINKQTPR
jgi:ferritin-like metal-binding protein YciE